MPSIVSIRTAAALLGVALALDATAEAPASKPASTATTAPLAATAGGPSELFLHSVLPVVERDCRGCHNDKMAKGGVNLAPFTNAASVFRDPGLWEKAVRQLEDRVMPPEDKPQPNPDERYTLIESIKQVLDNPEPGWLPQDPGATVIHRLNRAEYNNTLRDLLGTTNRPADNFPSDGGGGGGFDNNAATLFVPPILMERCLVAAEAAIEAAPANRLFVAHPVWYRADRNVAAANLKAFLGRAWRRPAEPADVERLLALYDQARKKGIGFEAALKRAYRAALVSPHFLFRIEHEESTGKPWKLNNYELASRLSYFLWASMPDEELFVLAAKGRLSQPATLEEQVRRMLADPKAEAFAESFAGQWLGARKLMITVNPDRGRFPRFTETLRQAMADEPTRFFLSLLRDDASLLRLLDCDYTYATPELARLYGVTNGLPDGPGMVRIHLPDRRRGGVLGMAAVLAQTSYPLRTSPVLRGKWILEEVLGTPPPPPPPLVATLPPNDDGRDGLTFRQELERHRKDPNCAGCHSRLDPLGFALENFDPIGGWRETVGKAPVDAGGVLVNGEKVNGPVALKDALLARKGLFIHHLAGKMLAFAIGRGLETYDYPTVKQIIADLEANDYKADRLVLDIVQSYPFQWRRAEAPKPAATAGVAANP